MNKIIQFVNRAAELEFLSSQIIHPPAFIVIYGRRRVGKSELIKQFLRSRKAIYLLATQEVEKKQAESFSLVISGVFEDAALAANPFSEFKQILEYLKLKDLKGLVLVIDEFPYLANASKSVPSLLQKYWDEDLKGKGLCVILCGSSIGAMESEVLGRRSPLYGRRTGQWKLDPLAFREFVNFFPQPKFERLVEFYSITGGIPLYILEFDGSQSAYSNAKSAIATRGAMLYQEAEFLLKEELREPKIYFSILKEVSSGRTALNELSTALGLERTALSRYLNTLMELELLACMKPVTSKEKSKNTGYSVKDNYFRFWLGFVYPFRSELDSFAFDSFDRHFKQNFNAYVGRQFEPVCMEAVRAGNIFDYEKIGGWWGKYRENGERKSAEIDLVCTNSRENRILFGECKWKDNVNAAAVLSELEKKAGYVDWNNGTRKEQFVIFAKSFKEKKRPRGNVRLIDLADLERIFRGN